MGQKRNGPVGQETSVPSENGSSPLVHDKYLRKYRIFCRFINIKKFQHQDLFDWPRRAKDDGFQTRYFKTVRKCKKNVMIVCDRWGIGMLKYLHRLELWHNLQRFRIYYECL